MQTVKRILLVEDDSDDQELFCDAIKQIDPSIECVVANNGKEALDYIEIPPPYDFIFLDLNMPVLNGFEFLNIIKRDEKHKDLQVITLTTSDNQSDMQRVKNLGGDHYLTKPTSYKALLKELKNILFNSNN